MANCPVKKPHGSCARAIPTSSRGTNALSGMAGNPRSPCSGWSSFNPDDDESVERDDTAWQPEPPNVPAVNPFKGIGRNDPCPCGSGKKFKKCCLGKAETASRDIGSLLDSQPDPAW